MGFPFVFLADLNLSVTQPGKPGLLSPELYHKSLTQRSALSKDMNLEQSDLELNQSQDQGKVSQVEMQGRISSLLFFNFEILFIVNFFVINFCILFILMTEFFGTLKFYTQGGCLASSLNPDPAKYYDAYIDAVTLLGVTPV